MTRLDFNVVGDGHLTVSVRRLLVAGFTGRDQDAVAEHIHELSDLGVPVPETVPSLYPLDFSLVKQDRQLEVGGSNTSGEVEPVVVVAEGRRWLSVGSDHTDRDLEKEDIAESKSAAAKIVADSCVPLPAEEAWDDIRIESWINDGSTLYQQGTLASLLPLPELLAHLRAAEGVELADGDVLFLGTLPAIGGIRPSRAFQARMTLPNGGGTLEFAYRIDAPTADADRNR